MSVGRDRLILHMLDDLDAFGQELNELGELDFECDMMIGVFQVALRKLLLKGLEAA